MLAYLDAASGSMLVQAIVAGVAGAAVFLKLFWRRLTSPLRRKTSGTGTPRRTREPARTATRSDKR